MNAWTHGGVERTPCKGSLKLNVSKSIYNICNKKNEYDADKKNATKSFKMRKINYVQQKLQELDQHIKVNEERSKWG